ncbi:MAG: hypothetical protein KDA24_25865 [Deltaproteobacteria bacterium]|nr:hypothetical protein [Deltaproteobacteria bacterium]
MSEQNNPYGTGVPYTGSTQDPYAPPSAAVDDAGLSGANPEQWEAIRREHLSAESNLKGFGSLWLLGAVGSGFAAVVAFTVATDEYGPMMGGILAVVGAIYAYGGLGLRRLDPKVKIPVTLLAGFGLLSFPIGTLINGYLLYLLHGPKGKVIFTERYRAIIDATPHVKYTTSPVAWAALAILILLVVGGIAAAILSA